MARTRAGTGWGRGRASPMDNVMAGMLAVIVGAGALAGALAAAPAWAGRVEAPASQAADLGGAHQGMAEQGMADLESAFWRCDYAATQSALDASSAQSCAEVHETLKQRKFGGDFARLLTWWGQHKPAVFLAQSQDKAQAQTQTQTQTQTRALPQPDTHPTLAGRR
jgi:hypothetical protein